MYVLQLTPFQKHPDVFWDTSELLSYLENDKIFPENLGYCEMFTAILAQLYDFLTDFLQTVLRAMPETIYCSDLPIGKYIPHH